MRILFVVNNPAFFLSHRLPLGLAAKAAGWDVHVATPDNGMSEAIMRHGFRFHPIPLDRSRGNPVRELASFLSLCGLYRALQPDLVHHVTIKPVIYGSLAARLIGVPAVLNALSGLGYVFIASGPKARIIRQLVLLAYRMAFSHRNQIAVFQNEDDKALLLRKVDLARERTALIRGSGVDLSVFRPAGRAQGTPLVILPARMLWDKGVGEFVAAAEELAASGLRARFALVGDADEGNPASIPLEWLRKKHAEGVVEWWGHRRDMPDVFGGADIVCLPSYREGLPKALAEAAACGKPLVTTDCPGCRDVVREGSNGFLVPVRDAKALSRALRTLLENPGLRESMGRASLEKARKEFSLARVVSETMSVYASLCLKAWAAAPDGEARLLHEDKIEFDAV